MSYFTPNLQRVATLPYASVQKQIYVTELNTSRELLLLIFCISQGSVGLVTHLRCGGKYDTSLVANLLLSSIVKEFLKSANIS